MELSCSNIKKFLIFSYISGNENSEKNSLYFRKRKPQKASYISGSGTFRPSSKKFLILQGMEAPKKFLIFSRKKAVLIFREKETLKKLFIFQETDFSYIS